MSKQIQDGTVTWETKDIRVKAIVDLLYPVGTVIAVANTNTPAFTKYGTWEKIGSGRVLWGADSSHTPGANIEAGLPNITGSILHGIPSYVKGNETVKGTGAFKRNTETTYNVGGGNEVKVESIDFNASTSNSIYGKSSTVQPPAYVVNFWRRTA